jgi:hypothetical protein
VARYSIPKYVAYFIIMNKARGRGILINKRENKGGGYM